MNIEQLKAEEEAAEAEFKSNLSEQPTPEMEPEVQPETTTPEELEAAEYIADVITEQEPEAAPQKQSRTNWKKRFQNFKSSADATIYELRQENAGLKSDMAHLRASVHELQKRQAEETPSDPFAGVFSEDDEATFGEDGLAVVKKATQTAIERATKPLQDRLNASEERATIKAQEAAQRENKNLYNEFLSKLEIIVPDFKKVNVDPGFLKWMQEPDIYSGITRAKLFTQAESSRDVSRVGEFFVEYKEATKARPSAAVEKHITPVGGQAATSAPMQPTTNDSEVIYTSEIDKFYDDVMKGRYAGRHNEVMAIEDKIDKAVAQNRIRKG